MNSILFTLLRILHLYWLRDVWTEHTLDDQRKSYQERIKEIRRNG